ncbi:MAG: hypothetical protein MI861_20420, partial [Pirellulales bacterium]|nr:hypothetical protein [Pirellulales bacterium]
GQYNDGAMFVLQDQSSRPHAFVAGSIRGNGKLFLEVVSVSPDRLSSELGRFGKWNPEYGGSGPVVAALQPPGGKLANRRLLAMRQIARSITFDFFNGGWTEARLLTQPVFRFAAPKQGIVDGAIFGYAESNDPEGVLVVWLQDSNSKPTWYWLAAGSTSLPLRCSEKGMLKWEKSGFWKSPQTPESAYVEMIHSTHPELVPQDTQQP